MKGNPYTKPELEHPCVLTDDKVREYLSYLDARDSVIETPCSGNTCHLRGERGWNDPVQIDREYETHFSLVTPDTFLK